MAAIHPNTLASTARARMCQVDEEQSQRGKAPPHQLPLTRFRQPQHLPAAFAPVWLAAMGMGFQQSCEASILFDGWETTSCGSYVGAVIAVILVAVLRQGLAALRRGLRTRAKASLVTPLGSDGVESLAPVSPGPKGAIQLTSTNGAGRARDALLRPRTPGFVADYRSHPAYARIVVGMDAALALAVGIIGAFNMLILMTMNWGLFLGVCAGEVVGMVVFDPAVPLADWQARLVGGLGDVDTCH